MLKNLFTKTNTALALALAFLVPGIASATTPGAAMATALGSLQGDVMGVITILAVVVVALLAWAYMKRAK